MRQLSFKLSGTSPDTTALAGTKGTDMKTQDHVGAHVNGLKSSIHALEVQVTILKQLIGGKATKAKASEETEAEETEAEETEEEDDFGAGKKAAKGEGGKKAAKGFDDDAAAEEEEAEESEEEEEAEESKEEEEEEEKPAKNAKAKKLTADDVNDACKARARALRGTRAEVLSILKKKFKVKSVSDLEPSQYADAIKAMKAK